MKVGSSHHVVSYEGGESNAGSNLETVLAGASNFNANDVEVLYKGHGGTVFHEVKPDSNPSRREVIPVGCFSYLAVQ